MLLALKDNQVTLAEKKEGTEPSDSEYDAVEVESCAEADKVAGEDLVKVVAEIQDKDIQKTGVICPDCYKTTDIVIFGVHKKSQ